jgi:hypothetical protein
MNEWFNSQTIEIAISVANAICLIFCFTKMGIDAWAAIIPIYGPWCLYERIWGCGWLSIVPLIAVLMAFVSPTIAWVILMATTILDIATYWRMFRCFGKGTLFCIFGVIFQPIAIAICAFDDSAYFG